MCTFLPCVCCGDDDGLMYTFLPYYSVRWGNAVAITSTVNTYFGSKVVSPSTGIVFNNQMDDFSSPASPNFFGLAPNVNNYPEVRSFVLGSLLLYSALYFIQRALFSVFKCLLFVLRDSAGKRPLSSMSPSIVLSPDGGNNTAARGGVRLVGGASGGPRIITGTAQVILNVMARGCDLLSAVVVPRIHTQLQPEQLCYENATYVSGKCASSSLSLSLPMPSVVMTRFLIAFAYQSHLVFPHELYFYLSLTIRRRATLDIRIELPAHSQSFLSQRGQHIVPCAGFGNTQFIEVDPDTGLVGAVSDPRKDGRPAAVPL